MKFVKLSLLSLFCCLISMGPILSTRWTISPRASVDEVTKGNECRLSNLDWNCKVPHQANAGMLDSGAPGWQEMPAANFYHHFPLLQSPKWDFYIGSGYPQFLDGHTRWISPSRIWVRMFPSDQGQDILVFFRFFIWVFGVVTFLSVFEMPYLLLAICGVFAPLIPYVSLYQNHVFLDVDMIAPWIFVWLAVGYKTIKGVKAHKNFIAMSFLIGVWIGLQAFIQAQITFALVMSVAAVFLFLCKKPTALWAYCSFLLGLALFATPQILLYKNNLPNLLSHRLPGVCFAKDGMGWQAVWNARKGGLNETLFGAVGIILIIFQTRRNSFIAGLLTYFVVVGLLIYGLPQFICNFDGISGVRFYRHLIPYAQVGYYLLLANCLWQIGKKFKAAPLLVFCFFFFLYEYPFTRHNWLTYRFLSGNPIYEVEWAPEPIPASNIYSFVRQKSMDEDRRHFALDQRLYPNWSSAMSIMDLRVLFGFYPKYSYELLEAAYSDWDADKYLGGRPDRFVGPKSSNVNLNEEVQKLMAVNHVSLISFSKNLQIFPDQGFYSKKNCSLLSTDSVAQAWYCPSVLGVGFFPRFIKFLDHPDDFLRVLQSQSVTDLANGAYLSDPRHATRAAVGRVIRQSRGRDLATYQLNVTQPGLFVFADTFFPGWKVSLNGLPASILRVNHAWKGVIVPAGQVEVQWQFSP